jgi:ankyrin repeat protein
MYAAEGEADPAAAKILVEIGAEINAQDDQGETALMKATRRKRSGMLMVLLQCGADVNVRSKSGDTALTLAARLRNSSHINALLSAGADVNVRNNEGRSAYDIARANEVSFSIEGLRPVSD